MPVALLVVLAQNLGLNHLTSIFTFHLPCWPTRYDTDTMSPVQAGATMPNGNEDWSKHPMYIALSSRVAATESAISSLSAQVNTLQDIVSRALPSSSTTTESTTIDLNKPESETIVALTTQISALSTSVAQLQRLQSNSQTQNLRQSAKDTLPALGLGNLSSHNHNQNVFNTGPLTAPHSGAGGGPFKQQREFHPPQGQSQGQGRPQNPRSISTNMVPPASGLDGDKTWGPPTRGGGNPLSPGGGGWPASVLNGTGGGNIPTTPGPGGMMTPSIVGAGNGNAGVPGAGIVVTKWDHLNLKPELVRSIQKYG